MAAKKIGTKTYATTTVRRSVLGDDDRWVEVEKFEDATIRDQGEGGYLRVPQAMLRAYSNDLDFFGDEDYQAGNGIRVVTKTDAKQYFGDPKMEGWVVDCDSDIALRRVSMDAVIKMHNYGHGHIEYIGLVSDDDDGWGGLSKCHIEQWLMMPKKDDN